ncbi:MAG: hypothetical protein Ct9H300mP13_6100 [Gammaproteobacteria bacterium]|nr:MAG: hypothetical protein Ct9H300mP13_6100 [Gammaproteobacteria bacterium]
MPAKVLMPGKASPVRIEKCRRYGAEVVFFDDIGEGFGKMNTIALLKSARSCTRSMEWLRCRALLQLVWKLVCTGRY